MPSTTWTKPFLLQIGRLNSAGRILEHEINNLFRVSLDFQHRRPHNVRFGFCIQRTKHKSLMERRLQEYIDTIFGEFAIFGDGQRIPLSDQDDLKRFLLMPSARILFSSVDGGIPKRAAAPDGPATRPLL